VVRQPAACPSTTGAFVLRAVAWDRCWWRPCDSVGLICLAVAALCWRTPVVRWGALLSAGMVAGAYLLPTPVGTNASRLPELFAAPMIISVAAVPLVAVIAAAAAAILVLPPVSIEEIRDRGDPALSSAYYSPLLDQLVARNVEGPIEVVPTRRRGEVAAVAPVVPALVRNGLLSPCHCPSQVSITCACGGPDTFRSPMDACDQAVTGGRRSSPSAPELSRSKAVWYPGTADSPSSRYLDATCCEGAHERRM
jgi:hypothetical protein